jgi:hypothetical protein
MSLTKPEYIINKFDICEWNCTNYSSSSSSSSSSWGWGWSLWWK